MPAMKPRGNDGPMEAIPAARGSFEVKIPVDGGGRIVFSFTESDIRELYDSLAKLIGKAN